MPFEMGKVYHEVIVLQVSAHDVVLDVGGVPHGYPELALGIHDVHIGDVEEAVLAGGLDVLLGGRAPAFIRGIALDNGSVDLLHEVLYQRRLEEIVASGFAGADFDGDTAFSRPVKGLIDAHQGVGADFGGHVDHGPLGFCGLAGAGGSQPQHHCKQKNPFHISEDLV